MKHIAFLLLFVSTLSFGQPVSLDKNPTAFTINHSRAAWAQPKSDSTDYGRLNLSALPPQIDLENLPFVMRGAGWHQLLRVNPDKLFQYPDSIRTDTEKLKYLEKVFVLLKNARR